MRFLRVLALVLIAAALVNLGFAAATRDYQSLALSALALGIASFYYLVNE